MRVLKLSSSDRIPYLRVLIIAFYLLSQTKMREEEASLMEEGNSKKRAGHHQLLILPLVHDSPIVEVTAVHDSTTHNSGRSSRTGPEEAHRISPAGPNGVENLVQDFLEFVFHSCLLSVR